MSSLHTIMIMERFHSDTLLPQDFPSPAKKSLVKLPRSESETNIYFNMDLLSMGDFAFKPKKRKSIYTSCYKSSPELNRKSETLMAPSSEMPKRKLTRVASKDDLWKSIQSNYTFLMADDLITECQETQSELHLSPTLSTKPKESQHKPHQIITHPEFLERFNRLHDTLHSLQTSASPVNVNETQSNKLQVEYQFLKEQSLLLKLMHPDLKDEVNRRCNILGSKMSILERVLFPRRAQERDRIIKSLTTQMKGIRKWLQDVEAKLRKLKISEESAIEDINDVLKQEKSLQREIEGQGKELTALVRQCQSLEGAPPAEAKRLRRAAAHLERSWHNIWLRSLEKQCLTEQRLIQSEENSRQEASDIELDEGPLNKHRRLTLDKWKAVATAATMDKVRRDGSRPKDHLVKTGLLTKDVGVHCCEKVSVNDKAIMVGTTAIDALKAEYGDDFTNFEIIQDVGYSSESSTHLSSDDGICIGDHLPYFNHHHHRVYDYHQDNKPQQQPPPTTSLKDELALATTNKPDSLGSSLGSSSGGLNDSGLGTSGSGGRLDDEELVEAYVPGEESDFLEKVLDSCVDFGAASDGGGKEVELQYNLSGVEESDGSVQDFHNRRSFTTSSQLFYKMISVDSENDSEIKADDSSKLIDSTQCHPDNSKPNLTNSTSSPSKEKLDEEPQTPCADELDTPTNPPTITEKNSWCFDSSPELDRRSTRSFHTPNLKRKRDYDTPKSSPNWRLEEDKTPIRVRSWLTNCSSNSSSARRRLFHQRQSEQLSSCDETVLSYNRTSVPVCEDVSSCDASGEYTSSSADESNPASSASSYFEEDVLKERQDSFSGEGSVETVIPGLQTSFHSNVGGSVEMSPMLPPPFSSTPSCIRKGRCKSGKSTLCNFGYPFGDHICGNMRWLAMKASSEGDLRHRNVHADGCQHQLSKLSKHKDLPKNFTTTSPYDSKHRLSSSLPNVLHHRSGGSSSDDAKSSARYLSSDKGLGRSNTGQDESLTSSVLSTTMSSSSDPEKRKKRRNRRKSSSSNRSSRSVLASGDSLRNRSRTLTASSNRSSSRMRHISQNSEFFEDSVINLLSDSEIILSQINIETVEELNQTNLKDELELALKESRSSVVLSPTESDVVLTQFEEQSIASDQVWDGYQDMPYLSEAYSEATVDEDAIRKLTEFGDDYGSAIGQQPLRYLDSSSITIGKTDAPKSPSRKSSKIPAQAPISDSDSDLEDLHDVVEEAGKALLIARASLKRRQSGDFFSSAENAELLATCGTHLDCLITLREFIEIDGKENIFSTSDIKELHYLISEWKRLKRSVEMYGEPDDVAQQKYLEAQKTIDLMFNKLSELSSLTDMDTSAQMSWDELKDNTLKLQLTLTALQETKDKLISVNIQVHRFMTEYGSDVNYKDCSLKENVTELYQKWDDIYEQNGARLTELTTVEQNWKTFDDNLKTLIKKGKKHTRSTTQVCDKNCLQSKDVPDEILQKDLKLLQSDAESEDGPSLKNLLDLQDPKNRIQNQTHKNLASRIADPSPSSADEDDLDDHFEDALHHLDRPLNPKKDQPPQTPTWRSSRLWRILRVAFPVQLTLVLLFCLACYLEPNCCDRLNNFTLSFTPHLRYPKGPPPV